MFIWWIFLYIRQWIKKVKHQYYGKICIIEESSIKTDIKIAVGLCVLFFHVLYKYWAGDISALMFSPPAFGPSDNSTRTFRSMDTGSQKGLVLVTNVPQSGPTVRSPQRRSLGPRKSLTNCSSISLGPSVIMARPTLWHIVLSNSRKNFNFSSQTITLLHTVKNK